MFRAPIAAGNFLKAHTRFAEEKAKEGYMAGKAVIFAFLMAVAACLGGVWMTSTISVAVPLIEPKAESDAEPIRDGAQDVAQFFKTYEFTGGFKLMATVRDESLSRRYYRVKLEADVIPELRKRLITNWTHGRFNRAVYQNGVSARLRRSANLPKWWNLESPPAGDHIMLEHGGNPNWYIVLSNSGEVCLMWCGN
jgi:hypothetical protein